MRGWKIVRESFRPKRGCKKSIPVLGRQVRLQLLLPGEGGVAEGALGTVRLNLWLRFHQRRGFGNRNLDDFLLRRGVAFQPVRLQPDLLVADEGAAVTTQNRQSLQRHSRIQVVARGQHDLKNDSNFPEKMHKHDFFFIHALCVYHSSVSCSISLLSKLYIGTR
jgi:hypothetical protein